MTDLPVNSPADTSRTDGPRGLYVAAPTSATRPERRFQVPADPAKTITDLALETVADEHPAPFKLTRLSATDEVAVATEDVRRVRQVVGLKTSSKATLWVDGPVDLALTCFVLSNGVSNLGLNGLLTSGWGRERLQKAQDLVASLPKEVLTTERKFNDERGVDRVRSERLEMRADGMLGTFFSRKLKESVDASHTSIKSHLTLGGRTLRGSTYPDTELVPLKERLSHFEGLQGLMGNNQALFLTGGWNSHSPSRDRYKAALIEMGSERADVSGACTLLLLAMVQEARRQNRATLPTNLHGVWNMNRSTELSRLAFMHRLLRKTTLGDNWTDLDHEAIWRLGLGVSGHVAYNTLDVLCHAPTVANVNATALTIDRLEDLDNPTVTWADGTKFYVYDGVEMNPELIRRTVRSPSTLLEVRNVEQRRVLLRIVGTKRLLEDVKAESVQEDDFGQLFKLPNGSQFVVVKNATNEHDGTTREYVLGARGSNHATARSAVASTWGLRADQYWPVKET